MIAFLLAGPIWFLTRAWPWLLRAYAIWLAAIAIVCLVSAFLTWLLWFIGAPIDLGPDPYAIAPSLPAVRQRVRAAAPDRSRRPVRP